MPLVPLNVPAGVYRNGTDLQSSGRWRDANLIRWHQDAMRPIGGWRQREAVSVSGVARGSLAWRANNGDRYLALGTHSSLQVMDEGGNVTDITPAAFTGGRVNASANLGFGGGLYGTEYYGLPRTDSLILLDATTFAMDNWGEYLVACSTDDGQILEWQLDPASKAAPVANAPTANSSILVTEERFLMALGSGGNPRKVSWSDRENNKVWTPAPTNEAGDIELQTNGRILAGLRTRGQSLIITSQDAHTASYVGPPFVYGFERVGTSCGMISSKAAVSVDAGVFWMGERSFYQYSGGAVSEVRCDVGDYVFSDLNVSQKSLIHAVKNGAWGEIWWFYPSGPSNEIDRYVAYNYITGVWMIGEMERTTGVDGGTFRFPLQTDSSGVLYEHEVGYDHGGAMPFAETGPISIGNGDQVAAVTKLIPDENTQGEVTATFKTRFHPNDEEREYGPYLLANPTSIRFTGRQVRMRVTADVLDDWRVGIMRLDIKPRGLR